MVEFRLGLKRPFKFFSDAILLALALPIAAAFLIFSYAAILISLLFGKNSDKAKKSL